MPRRHQRFRSLQHGIPVAAAALLAGLLGGELAMQVQLDFHELTVAERADPIGGEAVGKDHGDLRVTVLKRDSRLSAPR